MATKTTSKRTANKTASRKTTSRKTAARANGAGDGEVVLSRRELDELLFALQAARRR